MIARIHQIENAARVALGTDDPSDPLPPGPNFGTFGYFRLSVLIFFVFVLALGIYTFI